MSAKVASAIKGLRDSITTRDVRKLQNALSVPAGMCQNPDPILFLNELSKWQGFNPSLFIEALGNINPTLVPLAKDIPWLSEGPIFVEGKSGPVAEFVEILRLHLSFENWRDILLSRGFYLEDDTSCCDIFREVLKKCIVTNDLSELIAILQSIQRNDVAALVSRFSERFLEMSLEEFMKDFKKEALKDLSTEIKKWNEHLREFIGFKFEMVEPILGSTVSVKLDDIYTPLTIIKYDPCKQERDESGKTEIDLLRETYEKNADNQVELLDQSFCEPDVNKILFLIGNPGCGKTWLCNHMALKFGKGELSKFQFSLSIPCRNQEWHNLEEARAEKGQKLSGQCLQEWLALGMPLGADWTEQLTQHIVKTEGEGLLLIIDSVDEFTKRVPVETTVLSKLLQKQTLAKATLLVTSRPAAWNHISTQLPDIRVDAYYQVLGFSPANRDVYISKRLNPDQLKEFQRMLALHEEIAVLSLVPVNASLFTSLFQLSDNMSARTLTELYSHLFLYLIRRQLCRMKLKQFAKAEQLCQLDAGVLQCVRAIGEVAYLGVSARELTSTQKIPLRIEGEKSRDSECLGLVQVQIKELTPGARTEVWCFCHLTLQEFSAALFLFSVSWTDRCLMARFMVSSREVFSVYRMVLRFSCGLLCHNAASIVPIVFRHQLTPPVPYQDMPLKTQLNCVDVRDNLNKTSGWYEFSAEFASLSTLIGECHLTPLYSYLNRFLPDNLYFYFPESVALNDWNNFLSFLPDISKRIEVIYLYMNHFTPEQLSGLLDQLSSSCVRYLALFFIDLEPSTLESICDTIFDSPPLTTQLSIEIQSLPLTDSLMDVLTCSPLTVGSLSLCEVALPDSVVKTLSQSMSSLHCLDIGFIDTSAVHGLKLVQKFSKAKGLQGMHLHFPLGHTLTEGQEKGFIYNIGLHSDLREVSCQGLILSYSLLPKIASRRNFTYLKISSLVTMDAEFPWSKSLLQLLRHNGSTLRVLSLNHFHATGYTSLPPLLDALGPCTALLEVEIVDSKLSGPTLETGLGSHPPSLPLSILHFSLRNVPFGNSGLLDLCQRVAYHPAIRTLRLQECNFTSLNCRHLHRLIPTLSQLKQLNVEGNSVAVADTEILKQTASLYEVNFKCS